MTDHTPRGHVERILKELKISYDQVNLEQYLFEYGYQLYNYGFEKYKGEWPFQQHRRGLVIKNFHDIKCYSLYNELYQMRETGYVPEKIYLDIDKMSRVIPIDFEKYKSNNSFK